MITSNNASLYTTKYSYLPYRYSIALIDLVYAWLCLAMPGYACVPTCLYHYACPYLYPTIYTQSILSLYSVSIKTTNTNKSTSDKTNTTASINDSDNANDSHSQ